MLCKEIIIIRNPKKVGYLGFRSGIQWAFRAFRV